MNAAKISESLQHENFTQVLNSGQWPEEHAVIYTKEIREDIYLLFVISRNLDDVVKAMIARFDNFHEIGFSEPQQVLFYLTMDKEEDFHYFDKYMDTRSFQRSIDPSV